MSNLAKVFGVIAVLAGGGALVGAYMLVESNREALTKRNDAETLNKSKQVLYAKRTEEDKKKATELEAAEAATKVAEQELQTAKTSLASEESRITSQTTALEASKARGDQFEKKAKELTDLWAGADPKEFNQKKAELTDLLNTTRTKNQELQGLVVEAEKVATNLRDSVIVARTPNKSPGVRGRVLTLNRTWNFAVLNIGSDDGLAANSTLFVYRNRQLIGKLRISSVERKIAIGDVIPESTNASIQPGDEVFQ